MSLDSVWAKGKGRFDWWPDWRGEAVAIIASGPSTKRVDINSLRNRVRVIAIKQSVDLCPWANVVYGCDWHWWAHRRGLPEFAGPRLVYDAGAAQSFPWLHRVDIDKAQDRILVDEPLRIGSGGNSTFQAVNIGVQFGARGVILIGFDATDRSGVHWYGRNNWPSSHNPGPPNFRRWRAAMMMAAPSLTRMGVEVVNVSPLTECKAFPRRSLAEVLEEWA